MISTILRMIIAAMGIFTIARLSLFVLYRESAFGSLSPGAIALGFLRGLRFDASAALTFLALPILLLLIPVPRRAAVAWHAVWSWLAFAMTVAMTIVLASDVLYFQYVNRHTFDELVVIGRDATMFLNLAINTYTVQSVITVIGVVALAWVWKSFIAPPSSWHTVTGREGVKRVALILMVALSIRGSVGLKPLAPVDGFRSGNSAEGHLALNGVFTAWHASVSAQAESPLPRLPQADRDSALRELGIDSGASRPFVRSHTTAPPRFTQPPNVVVLLLESWGAYYVDSFGKHNFGATPHFDELAANGLKFPNFYANGSRSIEAIQAVLTAFPALMGLPTLGQGFEQNSVPRLGSIMRERGYDTLFYQSSDRRSFRMDAVASALGFSEYYGREDFPIRLDYGEQAPPQFGWDYEALMHLGDRLERGNGSGKPFFAFLFTGTTHTPFALPPQAKFAGHGTDNEVGLLNTLAYADWSIGEFFRRAAAMPWFANTVFVLTADHTFPAYRHFDFVDHYKVPLLIYAPGVVAAGENLIYGSHVDILPTILDLAGIDQPVAAAGRSLLRSGDDGFALLGGRYGNPAIIGSFGYLSHTLERRLETVAFDSNCREECFAKMEKRLLALNMSFYDALRRNAW